MRLLEAQSMEILVGLHNILRWVIVILAVWALFRAYRGWLGKRAWVDQDRKAGVFFGAALDTQLLLGIILWIFGSWGIQAFETAAGLEGASRMSTLYFALEHSVTMIIAVVLVHVASVLAKKADNDAAKHKRSALLYSLAVLLILFAIPWTQRPLFPGL
jgi:hypothetical protein